MSLDIGEVVGRLDEKCRRTLEKTAHFCKKQGHFEVTPDHFLLHMLDDEQSLIIARMRSSGVDPLAWIRFLLDRLKGLKGGNKGNPVLTDALINWFGSCIGEDPDTADQVRIDDLFEKLLIDAELLGFSGCPGIEKLAPVEGNEFEPVREEGWEPGLQGEIADEGTVVMSAPELEHATGSARTGENHQEIEIPGYRIIGLIGQGGMARVYRAIHLGLDREVAIKVVSTGDDIDEETVARFLREARIVAKLTHPNIIQIYDVSKSGQLTYLAMEYISGGELSESLEQALEPEQVKRILSQVLAALQKAHDHDYIHRDIKPANILFRDDKTAVLTDFGLARAKNDDSELTIAGSILGTPKYMSPEQARGEPVDHRSDLYSVGVLFFRMVEGELPYVGESAMGTAMKHIVDPIPTVSVQGAGIQSFVDRAMAKKPEDRFQSAGEMLSALMTLEFADQVPARQD